MNPIFLFEIGHISKRWLTYLLAAILLLIGFYCGNKFNLSVGDGIYLNSGYSIGFMIGFLSLAIIFLTILYSNQLLFREWDAKFDSIIFSFPLSKWSYLNGKFWAFFLQTFASFALLLIGFTVGQNLRVGSEMQAGLNLWHYLYPLLIFGVINSFFVCSFLFFLSYTTRKKLLVVVGGLFLYVLYLVILMFSNSPFMSGAMPQSIDAQKLSSLLDPFGLSAYFFEARSFTVQQRNEQVVPLSKWLLSNRLVFLLLSGLFFWITYKIFSFSKTPGKKAAKKNELNFSGVIPDLENFKASKPEFGSISELKSVLSFMKMDLIYLFKSIAIIATSILLLFFIGMEIYSEIEKGIRLPQKYASSGLMASTISENFHFLGSLIMAYFINDLYWRSHSSHFSLIEKSTFFSKTKLKGHFLSVSILLLFFTGLLILEGLMFQLSYSYFNIDFYAYWGVVVFNTFSLILFAAFLLLLNDNIPNRFVALGISTASVFAFTGIFAGELIPSPLLRIFSGFKGVYSDYNGYGIYLTAFFQRLVFGLGLMALLWFLNVLFKTKVLNIRKFAIVIGLLILGILGGALFMKGYIPENKEESTLTAVDYEKSFRSFGNIPQPSITDITSEIDLYPSKRAYQIRGKYVLTNHTKYPIDSILLNFHPDLKIESAEFISSSASYKVGKYTSVIKLKAPLQPNEQARLDFTLSYTWFAVNGHQSFNAIIENGSFMRTSNYYPSIGYQSSFEIEDEQEREKFQLGKALELRKPEDPEIVKNDFINLNTTLSTENTQTAIGTGGLIDQWSENNRNYFKYKATNIPFRFAVSSAEYQNRTIRHRDIEILVFYHKIHPENVEHLLRNAKITMDYCIDNFGEYPLESINFVEVSSFTRGFAATAYPGAIFMAEDMIFHANIQSDKKQDVINELVGHELSHLWWGNSQINPDEREGAAMLTETLAMYTEMMLYKKMYGRKKMLERLEVHQQIYENEKGLSENQPLYKVSSDNIHISYSKGAMVMVELSELIGEKQVNLALKNFLRNNLYPKKPTTLDLLNEFYKVSQSEKINKEIDRLFKTI